MITPPPPPEFVYPDPCLLEALLEYILLSGCDEYRGGLIPHIARLRYSLIRPLNEYDVARPAILTNRTSAFKLFGATYSFLPFLTKLPHRMYTNWRSITIPHIRKTGAFRGSGVNLSALSTSWGSFGVYLRRLLRLPETWLTVPEFRTARCAPWISSSRNLQNIRNRISPQLRPSEERRHSRRDATSPYDYRCGGNRIWFRPYIRAGLTKALNSPPIEIIRDSAPYLPNPPISTLMTGGELCRLGRLLHTPKRKTEHVPRLTNEPPYRW